jgi:hypothetical protein
MIRSLKALLLEEINVVFMKLLCSNKKKKVVTKDQIPDLRFPISCCSLSLLYVLISQCYQYVTVRGSLTSPRYFVIAMEPIIYLFLNVYCAYYLFLGVLLEKYAFRAKKNMY